MTDWVAWHDDYADPGSDLSRRLATVQRRIRTWADDQPAGPLRLISMCAGQGHDVVGALAEHPRRGDVRGVLVEAEPANVEAAERGLAAAGLNGVRAVVGDAGVTDAYDGAAPADLVLVCGVFGNVSDSDVQRTIEALPMLCAAGATVVWTRHRREPDLTPVIRGWFAATGFDEVDFSSPGPGRFAVGTNRLTGPAQPYQRAVPMFTFAQRTS